MRSGDVSIVNGFLWLAGIAGINWSSTAAAKRDNGEAVPSAYYLTLSETASIPSNGPDRRDRGFPLRANRPLKMQKI